MQVTAILAIDSTGAIGAAGGLPWPRLPRDMRRFRDATMGKVCLVGRRTYDTLPNLHGRRVVMLTRHRFYNHDVERTLAVNPNATHVMYDLNGVRAFYGDIEPEVMVIGGAEVYRLAWPHLTRILLTVVDGAHSADTYLSPPGVLCEGFTCLTSQRHNADADNPLGLVFSEWVRRV